GVVGKAGAPLSGKVERPFEAMPPLAAMVDGYASNVKNLLRARGPLAQAAESVHRGYQALGESLGIDPNDPAQMTPALMLPAAHAAWIDGFVLASAGCVASGLAVSRRSTELACYAAKIAK